MDIYEDNIKYLETHFPDLLAYLQSTPGGKCGTETAKNGSLTLTYYRDNTPFYIHSRFNPQRESEKLVAGKNLAGGHVVVMGLGLGYHLQKIMETKDHLTRVLLVEPDTEIIRQSLKTLQWRKLLKRHDFFYVFGSDLIQVANAVYGFVNMVNFDTVEYVELPSETRLLAGFFSKARKVLDDEFKTSLHDFKAQMAESVMLPRNVLKNLPYILKSRPTEALRDKFKGVPGFIVSAGPSLDANVLHLKKLRNRGLMIAVDTALKPLLSRSLQPHFTAVADPSYKNYLHLLGTCGHLNHFLAAEAGVAFRVFKDFHQNLFTLTVGRPITRLIETYSQTMGQLEGWGSVITIALELAIHMGMDPIVFVGQDFAYTDSRNHCRGTSWEEASSESGKNLDQMQRFEKQAITGNRKVSELTDIYGNTTYTSERFDLYKNFLERQMQKHPDRHFINATEGGVLSAIPCMSLREVLSRFVYNKAPVDFFVVREIPQMEKSGNPVKLKSFFNDKVSFYSGFLEKTGMIIKQLRGLKDFSPAVAAPVLALAEEVKKRLYQVSENGEIVEMWSPMPAYRFLKEFKRVELEVSDDSYFSECTALYKNYFEDIEPVIKDIVANFKKASARIT
ncbi:MAG: motility associated factor glycosyltransferase family protein [bacterium]|nr:motility associated factor glycosyltransferase family protein [bacterium]